MGISEKKKIRFAIVMFVVALGIVIPSLILGSRRYNKISEEIIERELGVILNAVLFYVQDNSAFPSDLSFVDKDEQTRISVEYLRSKGESRENWETKILRRFGAAPSIDISDVEYVRPTSKYYNLMHQFYTPEVWAAFWNLYGEFEFYSVDYVENYGFLDPVEGFPPQKLIVLLYSEDNDEESFYVQPLSDYEWLSSREKIDEMLVLQNAFLRRPVDESDIEFLLKGLNHTNSGFRFRSAEALAKLGRLEGKEFLDRQFESDDVYFKARAADALARLGEGPAIDFLRGPAQESDDKYIRVFAEITLREIGEWRPTETQYYTDERWKIMEAWGGLPLPIFEEDREKMSRHGGLDSLKNWQNFLELKQKR